METIRVKTKQAFISEIECAALSSTVCIRLDKSSFQFIRNKVTNSHETKVLLKCIAKLKETPKSMWANQNYKHNDNDTITIYENIEPNDNFPYFTCPKCQNGNITRAFNKCIDCGIKLKWSIKK